MRIDNRVPFGIAALGSYKIVIFIITYSYKLYLIFLSIVQYSIPTLRSPDIFAPACIPVTDGKKTAKIVKND